MYYSGMRKVIFIILLTIALIPTSAFSKRTSVSNQFPVYDNGGKPDLVVDPQRFVSKMEIIDRLFAEGNCAIQEGAVGEAGNRRLVRFDTVVMNAGDGDLVTGDRNDPNNSERFELSPCHNHYHSGSFLNYELLNKERTVVVAGHKQSFCLEDSLKFEGEKSNDYNCTVQGISSGWASWFHRKQIGQWIDITGVPEGDYIVRVIVNAAGTFDEGQNRYTNSLETSIHVPDPHKKVNVDNSPEQLDK
jgi:hypothetical protein